MNASTNAQAVGDGTSHLQHWFPVAFEQDLERGTLERITVFDEGFVVFRSPGGDWKCLVDRCPHRQARLSDGQMFRGELECLYHGWRFDPDGNCSHIPQLPKDTPIPEKACLRSIPIELVQVLLWIWPGEPGAENPADIHRVPGLEAADMRTIDYTSDLPYGQEAFNENVLDFAHIHVAHDGVRGGGHREHAGPLAFAIEDRGDLGFTAQFQSPTVDATADEERTSGATVTFLAPGLVHYRSEFGDSDRCSGLALYSIPLSHDRSRMLYRAYSNFWPQEDLDRKRWREHIFQMDLLEQDMAVVLGQVEEIQGETRPLKETWLPLKTSDPLVLRYRRWIDEHGLHRPGSVGWSARGQVKAPSKACPQDRLNLHTRHCSSCRAALLNLRSKRRLGIIAGIVALMAAAVLPWPLGLLPATLGLISLALSHRQNEWMVRLTRGPLPTTKTHLTTRW